MVDLEEEFTRRAETGPERIARDGQIWTFDGHRLAARALLSALGYPELAVPAGQLPLAMLPGAMTQWRLRYKNEDSRLTAAEVAALEPDESWHNLSLPQRVDSLEERAALASNSVAIRDRARGFATNLLRRQGRGIEAIAEIEAPAARDVFVSTGALVQRVWLNGELIHEQRGWTGWHAGKERIPARLKPGRNVLLVEAGHSFFLGVTDEADWALPAVEGAAP